MSGERRPSAEGRWLPAVLLSPGAKRLYAGLVVIGLAFLWANMVRRALQGHGSQFDDFVGFSRDLLFLRTNVYEVYPAEYTITKYPPFFALLFAPFVVLPMWLGASVWFWLSLALAVGAAVLSARTVAGRSGADRTLVAVPFLLTAGILGSNLQTAQVNILTLFLLCLALLWFREGRDLRAGAALGLVTALKLTPALFIAYFAYKRAYRVAAAASVTLVVCWLAVPTAAFGPAGGARILADWGAIVGGFVSEGTAAEGLVGFRDTNQSLGAAFHRTFTEVPARWGRGGGPPELYVNVAAIDLALADRIVKAVALAIVGLLVWLFRAPMTDRRDPSVVLEMGLVFVASLLLSPISWINHFVYLLFPYAVALHFVRTRPPGDPDRRAMLLALVASAGLVSSSAVRFLQALSFPFLGAVVIGAALAVALAAHRRRSGPEGRRATLGAPPGLQ